MKNSIIHFDWCRKNYKGNGKRSFFIGKVYFSSSNLHKSSSLYKSYMKNPVYLIMQMLADLHML